MRHHPSHSRPSVHSPSMTGRTQTASIPQTQTRALDRRHELDGQQRPTSSPPIPSHLAPGLHHRRRHRPDQAAQ